MRNQVSLILKSFQFYLWKNKKKDIETIILFARDTCKVEAAQFEIRADYRILKRKPDSTMALESNKPEFPSDKEKVSKLIDVLKKMINNINQAINHKAEKST